MVKEQPDEWKAPFDSIVHTPKKSNIVVSLKTAYHMQNKVDV